MRIGTLRTGASTTAVRVDDDVAVAIDGYADVGALLVDPSWRERAAAADGEAAPLAQIRADGWAPPVTRPSKIFCVGLNYRHHILEMGRELPAHPTLFAKFAEALIGAGDDIVLPAHAADAVDWEGEVAVIVGRPARGLDENAAEDAIAGFTVLNDVTMRDHQYRTTQWLQGKTFEGSTPIGPWMTVADTLGPRILTTTVNGEIVQQTGVEDMVFSPAALVSYISRILTLNPGDIIATGTPGGVGHARTPRRYLSPGDTLGTAVDGLGVLTNPVRGEA